MHRFAPLLLVMSLSARSVLQGTPRLALPVTNHPQEIRRGQSNGLQRLGTVSALVRGSSDDTLAEIHTEAAAARADYHMILLAGEAITTDQRYSQAILYRK